MPEVLRGLRSYFLIFLVGAAIEYYLFKNVISSEEMQTIIGSAWSRTFLYISSFKLFRWALHREQEEDRP